MSKQCCIPTSTGTDIDPTCEGHRSTIAALRALNADLLAALETIVEKSEAVLRGAPGNSIGGYRMFIKDRANGARAAINAAKGAGA